MNGVELVALALLGLRLLGSYYLIKVLRIQHRLLRYPAVDERGVIDKEVMHFRKILHRMTWVVLLGQVTPIIIDSFGAFAPHLSPPWLIFVYAISNAFTALTAAVLIWRLYQLAVNVKEVNELERVHVKRVNDLERATIQKRHNKELKDKS